MIRNWWVGVAMLHTLFAREHNAICDHLKRSYPDWDDNRLFNVARLVNAAVMAKIHSIEWTPAILPNPGLALGLNANWYGMLTYKLRKPGHRTHGRRVQRRQPGARRAGGQPHQQARQAVRAGRGVRRGLPAALAPSRGAPPPPPRHRRGHRGPAVRRQPAGRLAEGHRPGGDDRPLLLVRQPAPRPARAQQLPAVHAGAEHPRQPGASTWAPSTSCGPGSAACPATTSSVASSA